MRLFYSIFFLAGLAALPVQAEVAVASGGRVRLATLGTFDQMCHSLGRFSVAVIQQPQGGSILVDDVNDYPNFSTLNTRSHCNSLKRLLTRVSYQSAPGYLGPDEALLEFVSPEGRVRQVRFTISVRQGIVVLPKPAIEDVSPPREKHKAAISHPKESVVSSAPTSRKVQQPAAPKKPKPEEKSLSI